MHLLVPFASDTSEACRHVLADLALPHLDELLGLFGGRGQPVMAHMIEAGGLTLDDVREAERRLRELEDQDKGERR